MAFEFDLSETDIDKAVEGWVKVAPGKCHALVQGFREYANKQGQHMVDFEIIAHHIDNERGKIHTELYSASAEWIGKLVPFAIAAKLVTLDQLKKSKESGQNIEIEWSDSVGRQVFIELEEWKDKKDKIGVSIGDYGRQVYAVDDPRAAGFPRSEGMLKRVSVTPVNSDPAIPPEVDQSDDFFANI